METVRALKAIRGDSGFQQCLLNPEEIARLRMQALYTPTSVFLLRAEDLKLLAAACPGAIVDRGRKIPPKPLGYYFAHRSGLVQILADYRNPGQGERGIQALLASRDVVTKGAVFFVGVSDALLEQLWNRANTAASADGSSNGQIRNEADQLRTLLDENPRLKVPEKLKRAYIGDSADADGVRKRILLAAGVDCPVLIEGETGTGKEVVARMIHEFSDRPLESFFPVNCGGIPSDLFESELFGHMKGAFTGALRDKTGLWTLADAGTLFLDEIGDLSPSHQVKVLRALEDGKYRAVGGDTELQSNARIIAATNRDLRRLVELGKFREDLFYRLFTLRIRTPALREHPSDIPDLALHFWYRLNGLGCGSLAEEVLEELKIFGWPGNARELRSFLTTLSILADGAPVTVPMVRAVMRDRLGPVFRSLQST